MKSERRTFRMNPERRIFLIRHGQPDFPGGEKLCLGRTDLPLSPLGREQARMLAEALAGEHLMVFTSPLRRTVETAEALAEHPVRVPGLEEVSTGAWDGLPFSEIRRRFPAEYAARGENPAYPIPGGESSEALRERVARAFREVLAGSEGDIAVVTHNTVIGALLAQYEGKPAEACWEWRMAYGSYTLLTAGTGPKGRFPL